MQQNIAEIKIATDLENVFRKSCNCGHYCALKELNKIFFDDIKDESCERLISNINLTDKCDTCLFYLKISFDNK